MSPGLQGAELASPAPAGSLAPHLTTDARGRVLLSWLENREGGGHRFRFARLESARWSTPTTIAEGAEFFANWADVPAVYVTKSGAMVAHWLEKRGRGPESYDIKLKTSTDNGTTWSAARTPHRDSVETQHGFVSFFDVPNGVGLVWLDGRDAETPGGAMAVRSTMLTGPRLETQGPEQVIDARVCDCCPTAAAPTSDGAIVAFRDRSADEVRDIAVSRLARGAWTAPAVVHADNWKINACPVNGPAIAATGRDVAIVWHTGVGAQAQVKVAWSSDGGAVFGAPVRLDSGSPLGRVSLTMAGAGRAVAAWVEPNGGATRLVMRTVGRDGQLSPTRVVADVATSRQSGFPGVVSYGDNLLFAWTAAGQVKVGVRSPGP